MVTMLDSLIKEICTPEKYNMAFPTKNKIEITKAITAQLPSDHMLKHWPTDELVYRWWYSGRSGNGLRLSTEGLKILHELEIAYQSHPISITPEEKSKITRLLSKKMSCPFFLHLGTVDEKIKRGFVTVLLPSLFDIRPHVRVYDEQVSTMIYLYGDIKTYIESIQT